MGEQRALHPDMGKGLASKGGEKYSDMDLLNISDLISVLLSKYLFLV